MAQTRERRTTREKSVEDERRTLEATRVVEKFSRSIDRSIALHEARNAEYTPIMLLCFHRNRIEGEKLLVLIPRNPLISLLLLLLEFPRLPGGGRWRSVFCLALPWLRLIGVGDEMSFTVVGEQS
jgi:hypothetical protein